MQRRLVADGWNSRDVDYVLRWRTVPAKPLTDLGECSVPAA